MNYRRRAPVILARLVHRQLARPSAIAGRLMNVANARINRQAIDLVEVAPDHRMLEVGFGGGAVLARVVGRCAFVAGIDPSEASVRAARRRFRRDLAGGRLEIVAAEVGSIPFPDGAFDRALAVNTIYFWAEPERGLQEVRRVLAPGGRLVLGVEDRTVPRAIAEAGFRVYQDTELEGLLADAGFSEVRCERRGINVFALGEKV